MPGALLSLLYNTIDTTVIEVDAVLVLEGLTV